MQPLTKLQHERLEKISKLIKKTAPVMVELKDVAELIGVETEQAAWEVLNGLMKAGYLKRSGKRRVLTVVERA